MSRSRRKISRRVIRAVDKAGDASPYLVEWARAAGVSPRQLNLWRVLGRNEEEGLCRELSDLMDELDSLWIRIAEDEVRRLGFCPFEEVRVQGQAIDESSSAPLNVQLTLRPPPLQLGLRWLASKCPDVWGSHASLDHKVDVAPLVKVVFDDIATDAGGLSDDEQELDEEDGGGSESDGLD